MNFDKSYDPYKAAYGSMPSHSSSNPQIKQLFINGHFCYVFKFGIVTNGLGVTRHISFYNKDFMASHIDIVIEKGRVRTLLELTELENDLNIVLKKDIYSNRRKSKK